MVTIDLWCVFALNNNLISTRKVVMLNTESFEIISLQEMDKVKLMNRTDHKYWFSVSELQSLLDSIDNQYYILQIDGNYQMSYSTTYFDTLRNDMFTAHHNGKLNRYKIRKRIYLNSGIGFLEIKFKSNKGRTIKKRIQTDVTSNKFTEKEDLFIQSNTPYGANDLQLSLQNNFTRLTLVNKNFKERCTVDLNLQYKKENKCVALDQLVIVEIKSEGNSEISALKLALRDHRLKIAGFSKYCIGRTVTDSELKRNAFKNKIRKIEKVISTKRELYTIN